MTADPIAATLPESPTDAAKPLASYTPADLQTLTDFRDLMARAESSDAEIARRLEMPPSTLSLVLHARYTGRKAKYIARMQAMVDRAKARAAASPRPDFRLLAHSESVFSFIARCDSHRLMGFVVGGPGSGKTAHLRAYTQVNPDSAIYLPCLRGQAPRDFLLALAEAAGMDEPKGTQAGITMSIIKRLVALGQPIVLVDECDDLAPSGLRILQEIHDRTGCSIVLAGTKEFLRGLYRRREGTAGQTLSRMRRFNVPPTAEDDARSLLAAHQFAGDAFDTLWGATKPDLRRLIDAANYAGDLAGRGRQITAAHVAEALKTEMPRDI